MKEEQLLKNLIKQGEGKQLEFNEFVHKENIAKTLCAFLNVKGGTILIGVGESGKIKGVKESVNLESELKQYLFKSIIPEPPVTVYTEIINEKNIVIAKVWNGSKPPYMFDGNIYIRKHDKTVKATANDISKIIQERQRVDLHWERQIVTGIKIEDLDELQIRKTLEDLSKYGRGKVFQNDQVEEFLTYYGLYQNGNLTNASVVLFAKEPSRFLPQIRVRLTVFKDSKSSDTYIHDKILEDNLFRNIEQILQFFDVNIALKSKFLKGNWHREDVPYPQNALREGLMNALIHRDYSNISGNVMVAFYPDHLEITNSGELFGGFTPSDLSRDHFPVLRNPDIAHICFLRKLIEKIGRGTIMMIEDCETKNFPRPKWQSNAGVTKVVFPEIKITAKTDDAVNDTVNDTINDAVNDAVKRGWIDAISDTVSNALYDAVNFILANNEGVSINEIMKKIGKSNATVKRYLRILKILNLVEFRGSAKTGKYFLTQKAKRKITE